MKNLYIAIRSILIWTISILHFFPVCTALVLMGIFIDPRKNDKPQRWLFRNVLRLAGVKFQVKYAPGFDRERTSLFVCNHVDIWDAFIIYSAIPQFVRGLEHESHFKVPAYGWMMRRFGNVPVPPEGDLGKFKQMMKLTRESLDRGVSLIVFAEGTRTVDGSVLPFNPGAFRMAIQFGYPIVPMSIVGAFEFSKKGDWRLYPATITVHMHDTIETKDLKKTEVEALMHRVHAIVAKPVDEHYGTNSTVAQASACATSQKRWRSEGFRLCCAGILDLEPFRENLHDCQSKNLILVFLSARARCQHSCQPNLAAASSVGCA